MTDLRSELAWLVEDYVNLSDVVENDRGWPGSHEKNKVAQERAKAILAAAGWQPIGTAPKDGTQILIWDRVTRMTGYWRKSILGGCWELVAAGDYAEDAEIHDPTHWMPLPDPPKD